MLNIDGSVLEGGGQILRIALSLSCICKIPIKIAKIRAGRSKQGLAAQHLKGVELVKQICDAKVKGAHIGSTEIEFIPNKIRGGKFYADTQTAGSIALLLQVSLPVAYFANVPIQLVLRGGTNAEMAPQIDFITEIFRANLEKFGCTFDFDLIRRGYFPRGGGHVEINVTPIKNLQSIEIVQFGNVQKYFGWAFVANNVPIHVAHEMSKSAKILLQNCPSNEGIDIEVYKESPDMANADCSGIIIGCETSTKCIIGGSSLGNRRETPSQSGLKAAQEIIDAVSIQSCVDSHVQDQLIIFMALAKGRSRIRTGPLTLHTKTAIFVIEHMIDVKFNIIEDGETFIIECNGIGLENTFN